MPPKETRPPSLAKDIVEAKRVVQKDDLIEKHERSLRTILQTIYHEISQSVSIDRKLPHDTNKEASLNVEMPLDPRLHLYLHVGIAVSPYEDVARYDAGSISYKIVRKFPGGKNKDLKESPKYSFNGYQILRNGLQVDLGDQKASEYIELFTHLLGVVHTHEAGIKKRNAAPSGRSRK